MGVCVCVCVCVCSVVSSSLQPSARLLCPWDFPDKNTRVGSHFLLLGIFPTQWSNPGLLHCRQILYSLSHQGSPMYPQFSSVQFSRSVVSDSLRPHESQNARPPCPTATPRVHSDSRPLSQWCHPAISSSVVPFSSCHPSQHQSLFQWDLYWKWKPHFFSKKCFRTLQSLFAATLFWWLAHI